VSDEKKFLLLAAMTWTMLFLLSLNFQTQFRNTWGYVREGPFKFKPNFHFRRMRCGDLSQTKGIKELQDWREDVFTIDQWGFRNWGQVERPRVVVLGDSYVAGNALNDNETITYKMTEFLHEYVYNYAGQNLYAPAEFLDDQRFINHPPKIVIYAPVSRYIAPFPLAATWNRRSFLQKWKEAGDYPRSIKIMLDRDNYLTFLFKQMIARIFYKLGINISTSTEIIDVEGQKKITLSLYLQGLCSSPQERQLDEVVKDIVELDKRLRARSIHFIFAPVPESGTIYAEFYQGAGCEGFQNPSFVDLLFQELKKRGVEDYDLSPDFLANRLPYLYLPDDSHWNPRGVEVAAKSLSNYIKPLLDAPAKQ